MKTLITVLLLLLAFWIGKQLLLTYEDVAKQTNRPDENTAAQPARAPAPSAGLPGLPASLEASLSTAEQQGASGLGQWLKSYRPYVQDPRLASIELDYVVLISHQDPAEARRIFKSVKDRTPTFSPVYDRIKKLENAFQ